MEGVGEFREGDAVVYDTGQAPHVGDLVVAMVRATGRLVLRTWRAGDGQRFDVRGVAIKHLRDVPRLTRRRPVGE